MNPTEPVRPRGRPNLDLWVRRECALIVAAVAAYASYEHQREFAFRAGRGGADPTSAALWPLSVDGLLVLATVGLLKSGQASPRVRVAVWSSFLLGTADRWRRTSLRRPRWRGSHCWSRVGHRWPCC